MVAIAKREVILPAVSGGEDDALTALFDAAHVIERALELRFAEIGLGAAQQRVLLYLLLADGPLTPTRLANLLAQEPQSVSSLLIRLEQRGLLERSVDTMDRRRMLIALTPAGRAAAERSIVLLDELLEELRAALGDAGLEALQQISSTIKLLAGE
jgi:DNA-binding MarR family transcriptional regulator